MSIKSTFNEEKIKHLHHSKSVQVSADTRITDVLAQMREQRSGVALITNSENKLEGIFTERDVLFKVLGKSVDMQAPIHSLMTQNPFRLGNEDSVGDAIRMMVQHKVRHIPLVDSHNNVESHIDILNIVQFLVEHFPRVYNLPPEPNQQLTSPEGA